MIRVNYWKDNSQLLKDLSWESYVEDFKLHNGLVWLDMDQADEAEWEAVARYYSLDPYAIKTSMYYTDYPVIEEFDNCVFLATHIYELRAAEMTSVKKELDLFIGESFLITVHRGEMPLVERIRETVDNVTSFIRYDAGMLASHILHEHITGISHVTEMLEERVEVLETKILTQDIDAIMDEIMDLRGFCNELKRNTRPLAEQFHNLNIYDNELLTQRAKRSFRVLEEKADGAVSNVDLIRDSINGVQSSYMSVLSHKMGESSFRMNEVVHRLTVVSTIFLPLTFITGWFGMNFRNMPLINSSYGYGLTVGLTAVIALSLHWLFRRKGWYSSHDDDDQ